MHYYLLFISYYLFGVFEKKLHLTVQLLETRKGYLAKNNYYLFGLQYDLLQRHSFTLRPQYIHSGYQVGGIAYTQPVYTRR